MEKSARALGETDEGEQVQGGDQPRRVCSGDGFGEDTERVEPPPYSKAVPPYPDDLDYDMRFRNWRRL